MKINKKFIKILIPTLAIGAASVAIATPVILSKEQSTAKIEIQKQSQSNLNKNDVQLEPNVSDYLKQRVQDLEHKFNKRDESHTIEQFDTLTGSKPNTNIKKITYHSPSNISSLDSNTNDLTYFDSMFNPYEQYDTLTGLKPTGSVKTIKENNILFEPNVPTHIKEAIRKIQQESKQNEKSRSLEQFDTITNRKPNGSVKTIAENESLRFFVK